MLIYIILFLGFALFSLLDLVKNVGKARLVIFWGGVFLLIFLSSIRWETGPDWDSYYFFFRDIEMYTNMPGMNMLEPGYTLLNLSIHALSSKYSVFLLIIACITIGLKAKVIFEHRSIMLIVLFLYYCYYFGDIASVRQFLAVSITLFSSRYVFRKQFTRFLLTVLIASSIHISAIIFLLAYPVYKIRFSKRWLFFVLIIAFVLGVVDVTGFLVDLFLNLFGIDSVTAEKLLRYDAEGMETGTNPYIAFILGTAKRAIFLPVFILFADKVNEEYRQTYRKYLNWLVLGNIFYFLFVLSIPVMTRLSVYFLIYELFLWGFLLVSLEDRPLKFLMFSLLVVFGFFRLYTFLAAYWDLYIPFQTIFNKP